MVLIIGGAYQGKLDYAKQALAVQDGEIFICQQDSIDYSKRYING